ncbi:helix-turn-helix domain-containing protein [Kribbella sp. NBC_01505]|uniref:helix-turn-helix domain-containing protein n=1 Tax=Kribbella sp. NBC_01505 TaxID=2903580 RepID=UPI00386E3708
MRPTDLLLRARKAAGLRQAELACRAGTSRPTLSAYEHGRKSPTLETAARLLAETGFELDIRQQVGFVEHTTARGRVLSVPTHLPRLDISAALATVTLPLHLNWSDPGRQFKLRDRADRARVYETVLREGGAEDILQYVDGALLIDLWPELVLPREVRAAWTDLIENAVGLAA